MSGDWLSLRPTREQYQEFGDFLPKAHSWYKHLSLLVGRRFVVFVAPDAGIGRLVAKLDRNSDGVATGYTLLTPEEGPEFTVEHPRLHYGWKTTKEYRGRFGYLDYGRRSNPDEPYARDAGSSVELPDEIEERCGFVLYPYVFGTFAEAVIWNVHEESLEQLRAGTSHPAREAVLELASRAESLRTAWSALDKPEQLYVLSRRFDCSEPPPAQPSVALCRYLDLDESVQAIAGPLRTQETAKIDRALDELDSWLSQKN